MGQRNQVIDILKGIGITLMVFNHVRWGNLVHIYIQSFHMPLFFIVSGFLWTQKNVFAVAKKRFESVLVPYFIFAFSFLLIGTVFGQMNWMDFSFVDALKAVLLFPTDNKNMPIAPPLWFLPCFFIVNVAYALLSKINSIAKVVCITGIATIGMTYSSLNQTMLPFTLEPFSVGILFMLVGEYLRVYKVDERYFSKNSVILAMLLLESILAFLNGSVDMRSARYNIIPLYILNGILGTIAFWGIASKISNTKHKLGNCKHVLQDIGQHSMIYLCIHPFLLFVMQFLLSDSFAYYYSNGNFLLRLLFRSLVFLVIMLICRALSIAFSQSKLKWIFGTK